MFLQQGTTLFHGSDRYNNQPANHSLKVGDANPFCLLFTSCSKFACLIARYIGTIGATSRVLCVKKVKQV